LNRDDYLRTVLALMERLERIGSHEFARLLRAEYRKAARGIELDASLSVTEAAALAAMAAHEDITLRTLQRTYQRTIRPFGAVSLQALGKYAAENPVQHEPLFDRLARQWTETSGLNASRTIAETTRADVRAVIAKLQAEGATVREIAKAVRIAGDVRSQVRASTIAITEVHNAAMYASDEAARSTGLRLVKEWLAVEDSRVRPDHAGADGQVRDMDEPFLVGGVRMMRPGDPAAPANQVIRCRCSVAYREKRYEISDA